MSEQETTLISPSNLQTVVAVCFVLALLSVAFNFYNFTRINAIFGGLANAQNVTTAASNEVDARRDKKVAELEARLDGMKEKLKNMRERDKAERMRNRGKTPGDAGKASKGKKGG